MENIGLMLKQKREEQSKSLQEIHERTRVSIEHLELLESNDFTFLPETYVKSFLKSYADSVGLSSEEILNFYLDQQKEAEEVLQIENETENKPSSEKNAPNKILEWALGMASIVLLISLILVYMEYKTQLNTPHAEEKIEFNHIELNSQRAIN